jgi:hypothetical protein
VGAAGNTALAATAAIGVGVVAGNIAGSLFLRRRAYGGSVPGGSGRG